MPSLRHLAVALILLAGAALGMPSGQVHPLTPRPWVVKSWTEWTVEDCRALLTNSPWSITRKVCVWNNDAGIYVPPCDLRVVQFRSALPVRQARARLHQLTHGLESLDDDAHAKIQQHMADILREDFREQVVCA
jgi:hypothetical protein